jgi:hypothetical protein
LDFPELELPPPLPEEPNSFEVPFFGRLEAGNLSLPTLTLVIAACDAFNPDHRRQ